MMILTICPVVVIQLEMERGQKHLLRFYQVVELGTP